MAQSPNVASATKPIDKQKYLDALKASENTISFQENKGQWEPNVLMQGHTNIGEMVIKKDELYFSSLKEKKNAATLTAKEGDSKTFDAHGWGMSFKGYNPNFTIAKSNEFGTKYSYFMGNDPAHYASGIATYGEVALQNIYNGIDLRLYSQKDKKIEFDWVVNPGADYTNIKMHYKGQEGLSIDENGNLSVKLHFDDVKFNIPESYQVINGKKVPVQIAFAVNDNDVSFKIEGKVDNNYPLIIDPSLYWGVWMDGNDPNFDEYLFAIDEDNAGNVYCGGAINIQLSRSYLGAAVYGYDSTYNDPSTASNGADRDGIIYEIKHDGTAILAVTYFGSNKPDAIYGLSLSPDKSTIFACGYTDGDIPLVGSPFDGVRQGVDGFVAVFSSDLTTLKYSSYIGGAGTSTNNPNVSGGNGGDSTDRMVSVRAFNNTDFVIGGRVSGAMGSSFITNAADGTYGGGLDMYIAKFINYNTIVFGTYVGGSGNEDLNDLNILSDSASVAFSGYTNSSAGSFPTLAAAAGSAGGDLDGVVGVLSTGGGDFLMLSRIGGTGGDEFLGLTIGRGDTIYLTGYTGAIDFPLGPGANASNRFSTSLTGSNDAIIGKIPRTGKTSANDPWQATYFGGSGDDRGAVIRTYGKKTGLFVFGETNTQTGVGTNFPVQNQNFGGNTFYDSTSNGGPVKDGGPWDMFFFAMQTDLKTELFGTFMGGNENDYLGETAVPAGSNHLYIEDDSVIVLGTTSHSPALNPIVIGPTSGSGAVFDSTHGPATSERDVHLIFKLRVGEIFICQNLPVNIDGPTSFCQGDSVQLCASGPVTIFKWSPNGETTACIYAKTAGTYSVLGTDVNGCTGTQSIVVTVNQPTTGDTTAVICNSFTWYGTTYTSSSTPTQVFTGSNGCDSTVTLHLTINYSSTSSTQASNCDSYTWNGVTYTASTTVTDHFTNAAGCDSAATLFLTINYSNTSTTTLTECDSYTWNDVTYTVSTSVTDHFTNAAGCDSAATLNLTINYSSTSTTTATACDSYTWNGVTYNASTSVTKHFTNAAGCDSAATLILTINYSSSSSFTGNACSSYILPWDSTVTQTGNYTHHYQTIHGCDSLVTAHITIGGQGPDCTITGDGSICASGCGHRGQHGGSVQLCAPAGGGLSYSWSTGETTQCITVNNAGTYSVTVTNSGGCSSTCHHTVTASTPPSCNISGNGSICSGGSTNLCAPSGNGYTYSWSPGGATTQCITVKKAGTYYVTVTNNAGCFSTCSKCVNVSYPPSCTISTCGGNSCNGNGTTLCGQSNCDWSTTFLWSTGATTRCITVTQSGTYTLTVTNSAGCSSSCCKTITIASAPPCTITGKTKICRGDCSSLCGPDGDYSYSWSTGDNTECINVKCSGTYYLTVTNDAGCSSTCSVCVTVYDAPSCCISGNTHIKHGQCTTLCAPSGCDSYCWSNGSHCQCINVTCPGTYCVTVTNHSGCSSTCSVCVVWQSGCGGDDDGDRIAAGNSNDLMNSYGNIDASAYPNPFTSVATIEFSRTDQSSHVRVEVYTLSGAKVATLFDADAEVGVVYKAQFDAANLTQGMYMYKIISDDNIINGKLMLMKN